MGETRPALAASWMRKPPDAQRFTDLCHEADFVILRAVETPAIPCGHAIVLTREQFERNGAAEVFAAPTGWRIVWSQAIRGQRPWTGGASLSATGIAE